MTAARPILIVENDKALSAALVKGLGSSKEFALSVAATLDEADTLLGAEDVRFDAVILDPGAPDSGGHEYCAKMRKLGHKMPIIIVTGSDNEVDVVRGLDSGANDYVTNPFRLNELLARLRAQLRMFDNSEHASFSVGHYSFSPSARTLMDQTKRRLRLTNKETAILKFLHRAGAQPVARPILLNEVWGYNSGVTTHTLETHIYRLRQKIEINPSACQILVTVGGGYRLNAAA